MKVILSTRNPNKLIQIRHSFIGSPVDVLDLDQAGIKGQAIEDGDTLDENASKKSIFASERAGEKCWTMADDSGMFIEALNGEPGVISAHWAGMGSSELENMNLCLKRMQGLKNRRACFKCAVSIITPDGGEILMHGEVYGHILQSPRCPPPKKMPYSAIFVPDGSDKVWAEMSVAEENEISHRGKAFKKVRHFLEAHIERKPRIQFLRSRP